MPRINEGLQQGDLLNREQQLLVIAKELTLQAIRGIYEDQYGYRVVWPLLGKPKCKRFPRDTPLERLKAYRRQQVDLALQRRGLDRTGSFVRDVVRFLRLRRGRPSFKADRAHLRPWVQALQESSRWAITAKTARCRRRLARGRLQRARDPAPRAPAPPSSIDALDGAKADTPVDELELPKVPKTRPRSVSDVLVRDVAPRAPQARGRSATCATRRHARGISSTRRAGSGRCSTCARSRPTSISSGGSGSSTARSTTRRTIVYLNDDMVARGRSSSPRRRGGVRSAQLREDAPPLRLAEGHPAVHAPAHGRVVAVGARRRPRRHPGAHGPRRHQHDAAVLRAGGPVAAEGRERATRRSARTDTIG
jgi:hypothetical protein